MSIKYKLLDDFDVDLCKKVTPKSLKGLKELSLYDVSLGDIEVFKTIVDIFLDEAKLRKLLEILFGKAPEKDIDEIDLTEVFRGYRDFFFKLTGSKPS